MQPRGVRAAVGGGDSDEDVVRSGLGVFDANVEPAAIGQHARIRQLKFRLVPAAAGVFRNKFFVRKAGLGVAYMAAIQECVGVESR